MENQATYNVKFTMRCSMHGEFFSAHGECPECVAEFDERYNTQIINLTANDYSFLRVSVNNISEFKMKLLQIEKTKYLPEPDRLIYDEKNRKIKMYIVGVHFATVTA